MDWCFTSVTPVLLLHQIMRYVVFVLLFITLNNINAQNNLKYGLVIGINTSNIAGFGPSRTAKLDWSVHLPVKWDKGRFFMQGGIGWASKSDQWKFFKTPNQGAGNAQIRLEYLEVPLRLGYTLMKRKDYDAYAFFGGAYSHFLFGNFRTIENGKVIREHHFPKEDMIFYQVNFGNSQSADLPVKSAVNRHEFGLIGGVGAEFFIKNRPYFIEAVYNRSLTNVFIKPDYVINNEMNLYYGFRFGTYLNKKSKERSKVKSKLTGNEPKSTPHYGISLGGHLSNVIGLDNSSFRPDWSVGIPLRLNKAHIFYQATPSWVSKGGTAKLGNSTDKEIFRYEYLELPASMGFYLNQSPKKRAYAYAGMAMSVFMFGNYEKIQNQLVEKISFPQQALTIRAEIESIDAGSKIFKDDIPVYPRKREYSAFAGLGMQFKHKKRTFFGELQYSQALNSTLFFFEHPYRNQYFGVRVGMFLK